MQTIMETKPSGQSRHAKALGPACVCRDGGSWHNGAQRGWKAERRAGLGGARHRARPCCRGDACGGREGSRLQAALGRHGVSSTVSPGAAPLTQGY